MRGLKINRQKIYSKTNLVIVVVLIMAIIAVGTFYLTSQRPGSTTENFGELIVDAKGFDGSSWSAIQVEITIGDETYQTPFNLNVARFEDYVLKTPSQVLGNYNFKEWESGDNDLTRTVSLDFETGDLTITAFYTVAENPDPTNNETIIIPTLYTFENGFENGLLDWTGSLVTNGDNPDITTPLTRTGNGACEFLTLPTFDDAFSMVYKTISTTDDVYVRAYVNVIRGVDSLKTDDRFYLMRIVYGDSENVLASVGIRRDANDEPRWCLITARNATDTYAPIYGQYVEDSVTSMGTWTSVELHYNKTVGKVEVWINGIKQIESIVDPGDMLSASNVQVGIFKKGDDGLPPPTSTFTVIAYIDDVVIDDQYIGP